MMFDAPEPIPVATALTLKEFRAELGEPNSQHHAYGHSDYRWHRAEETILLVDWGYRREVAHIPLPDLVDLSAAYA